MRSQMIHRLAQCSNCNWERDGFYPKENIYSVAKSHAKKFKHKVTIETGRSFSYDYTEAEAKG